MTGESNATSDEETAPALTAVTEDAKDGKNISRDVSSISTSVWKIHYLLELILPYWEFYPYQMSLLIELFIHRIACKTVLTSWNFSEIWKINF